MQKIVAEVCPIGSLSAQEFGDFAKWAYETPNNCVDPDVIGYDKAVMLKAGTDEQDLLYVPLQAVLMFESIARRAELSPRQVAMCLARIGELTEKIARDSGHREIYFLCKDDNVTRLCSRNGYERLEGYSLLRKKLTAIEEGAKPA